MSGMYPFLPWAYLDRCIDCRFKNSDKVPAFVDRAFQPSTSSPAEQTMKSQADQVNGTHRFKYFRRPMLAAPESVIIKQAPPLPIAPPPPVVDEPKSKTVGTQSDYRENEAQTTPWDPEAVVPAEPSAKQRYLSERNNCEVPELLTLRDMKFAEGLPPGLQEVKRIEKMREKRAFEATLPPLNDLERLPLRQAMIEEWETKEWQERADEIQGVQDERLALLEQALLVREEEFDEGTMRRVEARKTGLLQEGTGKFAAIQAGRIKTMRRLIEARKYVEKPRKLHKLTVVEKYANFGSSLYAPVQREGKLAESRPIETEGFQPATLQVRMTRPCQLGIDLSSQSCLGNMYALTKVTFKLYFQGLHELENFIPARMLEPKIRVPEKPLKLNFQQRQDAAVQRDLKSINDLLDTAKFSKGSRGIGECWPAPLADPLADSKRGSAKKRSSIRPAGEDKKLDLI